MISFKLLEQYLENADLNLVLKKTKTGIAVSVLPKPNVEDKAKDNLIPLIIKGTAEELDAQFIQLIQPQLQQATGIITNIAEFEAQANELKNKSEAEKKAKDAKKKANENSKKALEGADKLLEENKFDECQAKINKALENNAEYKPAITLQNKLDKAKPEDNQVNIFNVIEEEEIKTIEEDNRPIEPALPPVQDEPQETVSIQKVHEQVVEKIEEKKEQVITEQIVSNEKPTRVDFESAESYEQRLKLWEKTQTKETELDEINKVADASPNVQIVTLPPQEPKPIEPNNNFDNEPKNMSSMSNSIMEDPGKIQEDMWARREYNAQQNNNNNINFH